ncbi:hypothetical protein [Plebeiibacterium sediminum]|uniref:Uncharacterized protein n=1 Tax=Plebeiibacterium sediminum TaxID=2992112 RepID=A0AAE3SG09_9BACT|nr:hypothetical protein [Plebeiobacterium sediminum]MCW3787995.1 hypothetical protein [Plebeiobacterium sediminum]
MLTNKDRHYAVKRKKLWDSFGWVYRGTNYLSKNHSLNCGCKWCRMKTINNRLENKRNRLKARISLANKEVRTSIEDINMEYKRARWY